MFALTRLCSEQGVQASPRSGKRQNNLSAEHPSSRVECSVAAGGQPDTQGYSYSNEANVNPTFMPRFVKNVPHDLQSSIQTL
jgi:hypothetical protein